MTPPKKIDWNKPRKNSEQILIFRQALISILTLLPAYALGIFLVSITNNVKPIDHVSLHVFLIAALIGLYKYTKLPKESRDWKHMLLLAIVIIAFLEESEFGDEIWYLKPYFHAPYIRPSFTKDVMESLGTPSHHVHSLHNFVGQMLIPWLEANLIELRWTAILEQINNIIILSFLFLGSFRIRLRSRKDPSRKGLFAISMIANGFLAIFALLSVPADPKNIWLFGYSFPRFAISTGLAVFSIMPIVAWQKERLKQSLALPWSDFLIKLKRKKSQTALILGLCLSLISLLVYQILLSTTLFVGRGEIPLRLIPVINYLVGYITLSLIFLVGRSGIYERSINEYKMIVTTFFTRNPGFIHVTAFFLFSFFIAQSIDLHFILGDLSRKNMVLEEIFELAGGFQLILATRTQST